MVAGRRKMDHRGRNEYPACTDNWSAIRLIFHFNSLPTAPCTGDVPNQEKEDLEGPPGLEPGTKAL